MVFADAAMPPEDESSVGPGAGASTETVSQESSSIMSWAWDGVVEAWNTGVAWIKWAVESIFETFISCLDWIIGQLIEMVLFVLDLLPTLNIPDSFNKGVTQFANFGQVMNSILPFVEGIGCIITYTVIYIIIILYRIAKSMVPLVAT